MGRVVFGLSMVVMLAFSAPSAQAKVPVSLKGSRASMVRQHSIAKKLDLIFADTPADVHRLVDEGILVPLEGNADYTVRDGVTFPYARPELRIFVERLAAQYHEGTGEKLIVTSVTRPVSRQPRNSHNLSVHPTGIAIDLRISKNSKARAWLESVLLKLERQELLDITRERYPPHYHVALFPEAYMAHVEELVGPESLAVALTFPEPEPEPKKEVRAAIQREPHVVATVMTEGSQEAWWRQLFAGLALAAVVVGGMNHRQILQWIANRRK